MRRFLLFGFDITPKGGMADFISDHNTLHGAMNCQSFGRESLLSNAHIFDSLHGKIVRCWDEREGWETTNLSFRNLRRK